MRKHERGCHSVVYRVSPTRASTTCAFSFAVHQGLWPLLWQWSQWFCVAGPAYSEPASELQVVSWEAYVELTTLAS
ncbi:hypothetical protein BJ165DRAFT_20259 [Panaeolus papilionaceus]|nr:hypothetical protein BJ165DRAFT_20259 [Panaeolus papilionaceus]